jgi:PAS domain S-box-containing protein
MAGRALPRERLLHLGRVLLLAIVYALLGRVGPALIPMHGFASLVWPSSGVALAALILGGAGLWPGVAIGALVTEIWLGAPALVAAAIAAGNTLEALAATHALRRVPGFQPSLGRLIDVLALTVLAGLACSTIGATVGTLSVAIGHDGPVPLIHTWVVWWTGDLMGILIIAPLLLTWAGGPRPSTRPRVLAEAAAVGLFLLGMCALLFAEPGSRSWIHLVRPHLLFLPLLWAAMRFGVRGAATGIFVTAVAAVWGTSAGLGVYAAGGLLENLGTLQVFLFTAALAKLTVGAVVSERQSALQSLRDSDERQRLAIDAAQLGTWCRELKTGTLVWSPQCCLLHGLPPVPHLTVDEFLATLHPDDRPRVARTVESAVAEPGDHRDEYRALWPDGAVHWISVLGKLDFDSSGAPDRMLGVAQDITARKLAEQTHADLLARERSARAEAQAATLAKDDFLAVLSHELRTPLQSILGWTQMLRDRPHDPHLLQKGLATIDRSGKVQAQLIEDLLDVSRIVTGKLRLEHVRVDLVDVVATAVESARAAAEAKSIRITVASEDVVGEVLGDPDRLLQVISNLLSNAVKFTPKGGQVGVRIERRGISARVVVEDSGEGISPEFLPHVFDRFRQQESTTRRAHGGLGLGLAIVRHLVELHGGTVNAESLGLGRGATFTVTLPLVSVVRSAITVNRRRIKGGAPTAPVTLDGIRVLVVDDDLDACELLETALRDSGAEVHAVHSVRSALAELATFHPDLLLSDIGMPEEDGYALIRQVRELESASGGHVAAVALTAFASQSDREQALALGFEEHLAKPTSPSELSRTVARLVRKAA